MISIHQFSRLRRPYQLEYVQQHGIFLELRRQKGLNILSLYAVESFYVEFHRAAVSGELVAITSFSKANKLTPYLAQVSIVDILRELSP